MKKEDDRLWSAYIDDELTVSELNQIEKTLSSSDLHHLQNEKLLEREISEVLREELKCPDEKVYSKL
jgi:hypothetical protein